MRIYDVTMTLRPDMPIYPGDPPFRREASAAIGAGQESNVSTLHMSAHAGTHVDAPRHFSDAGAGVDRIPPAVLVGPAAVMQIGDARGVTAAELERQDWPGVERVLLRTANSEGGAAWRALDGHVGLDAGAAAFLAERGLLLVGLDSLSVDPPAADGYPAHRMLLGAGIVIVEGLDLSAVPPGRYEMFCGPLKVEDGDGSPARVLLRGPLEQGTA